MASRRRKLQRSQSTLTSTSTHGSLNSNSDSIGTLETTNILSKGDRSSSTASFRRIFDSFRGKNNSENNNDNIVDKLHQYSWKYATWSSKRSKSMPNVEQQTRHHNQSLNEEKEDKNGKNNFSWSEQSGVKIIRSLSDLNQALGM